MVEVLLLTIVVVCIVDISGFPDSLKSGIKRIMTRGRMSSPDYSLKPFDCSLCMSFWTNLIYTITMGKFSIPILTFILLMSCFTPVIKDFILMLRDVITTVLRKIDDKVQ